jgi:exopolyphosphatase/guanosine-5'-triphosphate,3'-diphosphate pyrophosphatase
VQAFMTRYGVDEGQARRVRETALDALEQVRGEDWPQVAMEELVGWAADLHETGLSVSHSSYQDHSGYLVANSDMAGFSQQEQQFLATLIRHHRRAIPEKYAAGLPARLREPLRHALFCLRLACVLCRTREDPAIPRFRLRRADHHLTLRVGVTWAMGHPLTIADLEQERRLLEVLGLVLDLQLSQDEVPESEARHAGPR